MRILLDTNIIIAYLKRDATVIPFFVEVESGAHDLFVSTITEFELLRYPSITEQEEFSILLFLEATRVVGFDRRTARLAATLARKYPAVAKRGTNDLLIAATAIEHGVALLTRNTKDYRGIEELQILSEPPTV